MPPLHSSFTAMQEARTDKGLMALMMMLPDDVQSERAEGLLDVLLHERKLQQTMCVSRELRDACREQELTRVDRRCLKDGWLNTLCRMTQDLGINGGRQGRGVPICIDGVAHSLGYAHHQVKPKRVQVGAVMARLYRERHGCQAPQCEIMVDGRPRMVKQYWQQDRDLMQQALRKVLGDV